MRQLTIDEALQFISLEETRATIKRHFEKFATLYLVQGKAYDINLLVYAQCPDIPESTVMAVAGSGVELHIIEKSLKELPVQVEIVGFLSGSDIPKRQVVCTNDMTSFEDWTPSHQEPPVLVSEAAYLAMDMGRRCMRDILLRVTS